LRAVVQRVSEASVTADGRETGKIGGGLLILLGISVDDIEEDVEYLANKILKLRIFDDKEGRMNLSLLDTKGDILIISQFTLYGDCRKGNRPSYDKAAGSESAKPLYEMFVKNLRESGLKVEEGSFGAFMEVSLTNSGPVTIILDSLR